MQKKGLNILLIVVVVSVWVVVIYRVVNRYASASGQPINEITTTEKIPAAKKTADTFELIGDYRDPFLGATPAPVRTNQNNNTKKEIKKTEPVKTDTWPSVKYIGMVKNNDSGKMVALMNIAGKEIRMNPGQDFNGIKLDKMYKDSCMVSMNKEKKIIIK